MTRRASLAVVLLGSWIALIGSAPAQAKSCNERLLNAQAQATSCGELGWSYDPQAKAFGYGSQVTASDDPDGSRFVYSLVTACDQSVSAGGGGSCANFGNCPPRVDPDGEPLRA